MGTGETAALLPSPICSPAPGPTSPALTAPPWVTCSNPAVTAEAQAKAWFPWQLPPRLHLSISADTATTNSGQFCAFQSLGVNTTAYTRCNPSSARYDGQQGGVGAPSEPPRFGPQFDSTIEVIMGKTKRWEAQVWA